MIVENLRETITETEKIVEYTTTLKSGTKAHMKVHVPILSKEEHDRRYKELGKALERYYKAAVAQGYEWIE